MKITTLKAGTLFMTSVLVTFPNLLSASTPDMEPDKSTVTVHAPVGEITGRSVNGLNLFKGIPYAETTAGENRWKPPVPINQFETPFMADEFGPSCVQPDHQVANIYTNDIRPKSEDCLSLNIWAPKNAEKTPVFVWIHGGALNKGASREPMYNGERLAGEGVVFVSINYRLGALGFMAHPQLSAESEHHVSGNYGLLDQIAALRWIKTNIASFGGNADNVTIAGESAGGLSVMYLMAIQQARGLFHKAIVQSGYMISVPRLKKPEHGEFAAENVGAYIAGKLGVPDIKALRNMDAQELTDNAALHGYFPSPVIDDYLLTRQLVETFEQGEQSPVPLLVGFNSGEIRSLKVLAPKAPDSAKEYETTIHSRYQDLADEFLRLYPSTDMQESIYATTRDALYGWTSQRMAKMQTEIGQPAFLYLWDHAYPAATDADLHGFHASEIPYIMGTFAHTPGLWPKNPDTESELAFSKSMSQYWSSFANNALPKAKGQPDWQPYGEQEYYMDFVQAPLIKTNMFPGMFELHEQSVCRKRLAADKRWNWNVGILSPILNASPDQCDH